MTKSRLARLLVRLLVFSLLITIIVPVLKPGSFVFAQAPCDPKLCTETPTYPPKVTDTPTYPPKITDTYPPKITDTYPPKPTYTPSDTASIEIPSNTPTTQIIYSTRTPTASLTPTATLKPTDLGITSIPTNTPTLKPAVLGITSTALPTSTRTLAPIIPLFQPTSTIQPVSARVLPFVDLSVTGIEVSQAVQIFETNTSLDNSIPLIARKKTVVRVYLRAVGGYFHDVTGRLTVTGGGSPGRIHLPVTYYSSSVINLNGISYRSDRTSTLNFILDYDEVYSGNRHLSLVVYFLSGRPETITANNSVTMDIRFQEVPPISMFGIVYGNDGTDPAVPPLASPPWSDLLAQAAVALNMAPVANFSVGYFPGLGGSPLTFPNIDAAISWADRMLARPEYLANRIYVLQPERVFRGGAYGHRMHGPDENGINLGRTMAQEVAHTYGMWWHAVSVEHPANLANPLFPYPHGSVGSQVGAKTEPVFDTVLPTRLYGLEHNHDFMSYGNPPVWVSPFTYCAYMRLLSADSVTCPPGAERASQPASTLASIVYHTSAVVPLPYLYVAGALYPDGTASFEPFEQMTTSQDISDIPSGDVYHLVFRSADGTGLKDFPFTPVETHHDEINPTIRFNLVVPYPPGTARIQLLQNDLVLAEKIVSPHAPLVAFDFAGNDQALTGTKTFTWSATDADGGPLIYAIEYSRDNGNTWLTLNVGLTIPSADVNFSALPGTRQGMLRVVASDGVNTGEARSTGVFTVDQKAPIITSISANATTYQGQPVYAEITAFDWEDGPITDPSLITWTSDRDGPLTSGSWIAPADLSLGVHTLTATVRDLDGNTVSKSMVVKVLASDIPARTGPVSLWEVLLKYGAVVVILVLVLLGGVQLLRRKRA